MKQLLTIKTKKMSNYEIEGKLIVKENVQDVTSSFKKREFVIEVLNEKNAEWNDFIKFQLTQDRCSLLDNSELGEKIKVTFNVRGRKWEKEGKTIYFTTLECWKLLGAENETNVTNVNQDIPTATEDDLPF